MLSERYKSFVSQTQECWIWTGPRNNRDGRPSYGRYHEAGKSVLAHRMMWIALFGDPGSRSVCHTCDNPLCVRPSHLFLGTQSDNMLDASRKGRLGMQRYPERSSFAGPNRKVQVRGEQVCGSRFTREQVLGMRERLASGASVKSVADEFSASVDAVRRIRRRRTWAWLPDSAQQATRGEE